MLRHATINDFDLVMSMVEKFSRTIALKEYVEREVLELLVLSFISTDRERIVFLYDDVGMLAASIDPFLLGNTLAANELAWWVEPEYRNQNVGQQLAEAYENWAKEKGCKIISMACYAENNLGKFYEKMGYRLNELGYTKCLPP